jgi:hypothetical protein
VAADSDVSYAKLLFNVLQIKFDSNSSIWKLKSTQFHEAASLDNVGP